MSSRKTILESTPSKKVKSPHTGSTKKRKQDTAQIDADGDASSPATKKPKNLTTVDVRGEDGKFITVDMPVWSQDDNVAASQKGSLLKAKKKSKKLKDLEVVDGQTVDDIGLQGTAADVQMEDIPAKLTEAVPMTGAEDISVDAEEADSIPPTRIVEADSTLLDSDDPTCFYSTRISLYVPGAPIGLGSPISSLISLHLSPLLLTYFPPAKGVVLAFSDPVISAKANSTVNRPLLPPISAQPDRQPAGDTPSVVGDEYCATWVWLTATFLVFRPEREDRLKGWNNVASEGFIGLISYNYFQTAVDKSRIPDKYLWNGSSISANQKNKRVRKGRLRDAEQIDQTETDGVFDVNQSSQNVDAAVDIADDDEGAYFVDKNGGRMNTTQEFRVVDTEIVPSHEKDRWSIQISGSLLDRDAEAKLSQQERVKFDQLQSRFRHISVVPDVVMSGGVGHG